MYSFLFAPLHRKSPKSWENSGNSVNGKLRELRDHKNITFRFRSVSKVSGSVTQIEPASQSITFFRCSAAVRSAVAWHTRMAWCTAMLAVLTYNVVLPRPAEVQPSRLRSQCARFSRTGAAGWSTAHCPVTSIIARWNSLEWSSHHTGSTSRPYFSSHFEDRV
jgi:hypothetical protein